MPFNFTAGPVGYRTLTQGKPFGIFYVGDTVTFSLLAGAGATAYTVRDFWGNIVSTGTPTSGAPFTVTAPAGGWLPGWYRIYLTGTTSDPTFGTSMGVSNFVVYRPDSRFPVFTALTGDNRANIMIAKAVSGAGTSRLDQIQATAAWPATVALVKDYWSTPSNPAWVDPARQRRMWFGFPNEMTDSVTAAGMRFYMKDPAGDGTTMYVGSGPGTSTGTKFTVYSPDSTTVVETYDNLTSAAAATAAVTASTRVVAFPSGGAYGGTAAATAIGRTQWNTVVSTVQALYPTVQCYEGPTNEPNMASEGAPDLVHRCKLFTAAVHAGDPGAKSLGPATVTIDDPAFLEAFFAAGGGAAVDELSFHNYNGVEGGNITIGRAVFDTLKAKMAAHGVVKPVWDTESNGVMVNHAGVYAPRVGAEPLIQTLLSEQYGIPSEQCNFWYDDSHGFWSFPSWMINEDRALNPQVALYRHLAEETWGRTFTQALTFGELGDRVFLGSVYRDLGGSTAAGVAVLVAVSLLPGATVTLNVTGTTGPLTYSYNFGETGTLPVTDGRVTVPVSDIPTYLRIPTGATVTVRHCNDWPPINNPRPQAAAGTCTISGAAQAGMVNRYWQTSRRRPNPGDATTPATFVPGDITVTYDVPVRMDRVLIWSFPGIYGNGYRVPLDFDVQTTDDGVAWTTRATVDRTAEAVSFPHVATSGSGGCRAETFWRGQWIFDVPLGSVVNARGVRLHIRSASYSDLPDLAAHDAGYANLAVYGNGTVSVQEILPLADVGAGWTVVL